MASQSEVFDAVVGWMERHRSDSTASFMMLDADLSGNGGLAVLHGQPNSKRIWAELRYILEMFAATGQWSDVLRQMLKIDYELEPPMKDIRRIMRERPTD